MKPKFYKWTVQIEVSENWIEDGFDLDEERLQAMVLSDLSFAYSSEVRVKILKSPSPEAIAKAQGYKV
jgi:hypothetical protein